MPLSVDSALAVDIAPMGEYRFAGGTALGQTALAGEPRVEERRCWQERRDVLDQAGLPGVCRENRAAAADQSRERPAPLLRVTG